MSLKAFHLVFVTVSVLLSLGFGVWAITDYQKSGSTASLCWGVGSFAAAVALVVYGRWFLRKLKGVGYL